MAIDKTLDIVPAVWPEWTRKSSYKPEISDLCLMHIAKGMVIFFRRYKKMLQDFRRNNCSWLRHGYGNAQRLYVKRGYVPDVSGVWYNSEVLEQYAECCNDDSLVLYTIKSYVRS